jgi:hypothetical protein
VFQSPRFALKGGTALNLFLHDMPRLSVDIDVVFTDHTLGREDALRAIAADLKFAKSAISALGYRASLPTTKSGDNVKLFVEGNGLRIKVEVNFVFRGTVLPVTRRSLMPIAQELFTTDIVLPVLDPAELYGGRSGRGSLEVRAAQHRESGAVQRHRSPALAHLRRPQRRAVAGAVSVPDEP